MSDFKPGDYVMLNLNGNDHYDGTCGTVTQTSDSTVRINIDRSTLTPQMQKTLEQRRQSGAAEPHPLREAYPWPRHWVFPTPSLATLDEIEAFLATGQDQTEGTP